MNPKPTLPTAETAPDTKEKLGGTCADNNHAETTGEPAAACREDVFSRKRELLSERPESARVYPFIGLWVALTALTVIFAFVFGVNTHLGEHPWTLSWCCPRCIIIEVLIVSVVSTFNIYLIWRLWNRYH